MVLVAINVSINDSSGIEKHTCHVIRSRWVKTCHLFKVLRNIVRKKQQ